MSAACRRFQPSPCLQDFTDGFVNYYSLLQHLDVPENSVFALNKKLDFGFLVYNKQLNSVAIRAKT